MKAARPLFVHLVLALFASVFSSLGQAQESAASVKSYLLKNLEKINAASEDFVINSEAYSPFAATNAE